MKKILVLVLSITLLSMLFGTFAVAFAAEDDPATPNLDESLIDHNTTIPVTGSWGPTSSVTYDNVNGWGDDDWELTVSAFGFLTVTVEDCCYVGDYYEIWVDGVMIGATPDPGVYGVVPADPPYLSVGSATVWLAPGVHTIEIRDTIVDNPDFGTVAVPGTLFWMIPAGYDVTGVWEPVVEFTKEITSTTEAGDGDGVIETGEDWQWTLEATLTNVSGETIHIDKVHDRLGGDIEWHVIVHDGVMGSLETYTKGKTEKSFLNWYDGFDLADGASVSFSMTISPDMNTGNGNGKNLKFPDGHQEFTSAGEHCLNSGAYFEGYIGDDFIWGDSNSICVDVEEYVETPS